MAKILPPSARCECELARHHLGECQLLSCTHERAWNEVVYQAASRAQSLADGTSRIQTLEHRLQHLEATLTFLDEEHRVMQDERRKIVNTSEPALEMRAAQEQLSELQKQVEEAEDGALAASTEAQMARRKAEAMRCRIADQERQMRELRKTQQLLAVTPDVMEEDHAAALERLAASTAEARNMCHDAQQIEQMRRLCKSLE